jgi:Mg2+ and Co2+ transporter CorA
MTALGTLAVPLVIVTGVYGMNFGEHPWIPMWPFHVLSALFLLAVPIMFVIFRKSKWL